MSKKNASEHPVVSMLAELLAVPAPGGREKAMAGLISGKLKALGYSVETDPAGNVLTRIGKPGKGRPLVMLAAHIDEIGLVVTHIQSDGKLQVAPSGGILPHKIGERPVDIVGDGRSVTGVLSIGLSGHSDRSEQVKPMVQWEDCRVLTGLSPSELARAGIRPGATVVPQREQRGPVLLGPAADPMIAAWTFDDRMGCIALLRMLEAMRRRKITPACPLIVAFTIQEEGGCYGAKVLAHREKPEVFLAVDGCPITPEAPLLLDGRPGVWSKDRIGHYDQRLVYDLCRLARDAGTELQPVVYKWAASDASYVFDAGAAPRVAFFGHVRENSHGFEVARLSVFDNVLKTLLAFVSEWKG